ncbi:hypothetical protein B0H14DRAFT_449031 [Mycena olivaceomarginata]|nr:hypothetical protein B0H14DRAFT_449031 [Mycena olivaceomarginata]
MPGTEQRRYSASLAESDIRHRRHPRPRCTKVDSARRCPCTPPLPHPPSHPSLHGARVSGYGVDAHRLRAHSRPRFPRVARSVQTSPSQWPRTARPSASYITPHRDDDQRTLPTTGTGANDPHPHPRHHRHLTPCTTLLLVHCEYSASRPLSVEMYGVHTIRTSSAERNGTGKGRRTNTRTRLRPPHSTFMMRVRQARMGDGARPGT